MGIRSKILKKAANQAQFFKYDKDGIPSGLTGLGKTYVMGAGIAAGAYSAFEENERLSMGKTDGIIYGNTPGYKNYLEMRPKRPHNPLQAPAGADGSLVFALHNTRNGGFL